MEPPAVPVNMSLVCAPVWIVQQRLWLKLEAPLNTYLKSFTFAVFQPDTPTPVNVYASVKARYSVVTFSTFQPETTPLKAWALSKVRRRLVIWEVSQWDTFIIPVHCRFRAVFVH